MKTKKYIIIIVSLTLFFFTKSNATEECFEKTSRAIFKFNMVIDNAVIEPIAKGYNKLPECV